MVEKTLVMTAVDSQESEDVVMLEEWGRLAVNWSRASGGRGGRGVGSQLGEAVAEAF